MSGIDKYLGKRTLITGDVNSGKTSRTLNILKRFISAGYGDRTGVLDLSPDEIRGVGGKIRIPRKGSILYLTGSITAPRLTGRDEGHILELANRNAEIIEILFKKFESNKREVLFINDATLYLQAGAFDRFEKILRMASTCVINAYQGKTFSDSAITVREKRLTDQLRLSCDRVIHL